MRVEELEIKGQLPNFISQLLNGEVGVFVCQQSDGSCAVIEITMWKNEEEAEDYVSVIESENMRANFSTTEH